jgi:hypothetical protein
MDAHELQMWIARRLGGGLVSVELCPENIEDAISEAIRWFSAKKGVTRHKQLPFYGGQNCYTLDCEIDTVLDVRFPVAPLDLSLVFSPYILQDEKVPYDVFAAPQTAGLYSTYTQSLQYIQTAKRILNSEEDWRQEDRQLYLFPVPRQSGFVDLLYKSSNFTIEQLSQRDHDIVKRFALAWAKLDLGTVRSKYPDGFPGAQGSVRMDGSRLLEEGHREISELNNEIAQSGFPMLFLTG